MRPRRWGLTIPLSGIPLSDHETVYREAEAIGYTDFWSAESDVDPWICLALGACQSGHDNFDSRVSTAPTRSFPSPRARCCRA